MADTIGERVRAAREKSGLSRWEAVMGMAKRGVDAPQSWLRDLEDGRAGRVSVNVVRLNTLASVLGVELDRLLPRPRRNGR